MASCIKSVVKYSLLLLCLANIVLGSFLVLSGFSVANNLSEFKAFIIPAKYFEAPYSAFTNGLCLYLSSIIGLCGIAKEKGFLMLLHSGLLGHLILMGGAIIHKVNLASIIIQQDLQNSMLLTLQRFTENSRAGSDISLGWTLLQTHLHCCGVMNYTDWIDSANRKPFRTITNPIPPSCCKDHATECTDAYFQGDYKNMTGHLFTEGCLAKSVQHIHLDKIKQPLVPLEYMGATGVVLSLLLAWHWREND